MNAVASTVSAARSPVESAASKKVTQRGYSVKFVVSISADLESAFLASALENAARQMAYVVPTTAERAVKL